VKFFLEENMKLFEKGVMADIFIDHFEHPCIFRAAEDLSSDLLKITGQTACIKQFLPDDEKGFLIIGSLENERFAAWLETNHVNVESIKEGWEKYILKTIGPENKNMLICGSDRRGAMYGIYHVCEHFLGVDPQYFWTDNEPKKQDRLVFDLVDIQDGPETYKYRGWFINDEDLLSAWKDGGGKRNYLFFPQAMHQSITEKIAETALRLRLNLLDPCSGLNIQSPPDESIVKIVNDRGLFITSDHANSMGLNYFGWEMYWNNKGKNPVPSFVENPRLYEEIWRYVAKKWSPYEHTIWQLGLRGRGDRPVWVHDPKFPGSMEERGKIISKAIRTQYEIIKETLNRDDFVHTMTLWAEGGELFRQGYLELPENTTIIFTDTGWTQMWGADFHTTSKLEGCGYGGYYHIGFWDSGPRYAQANSPEKIYYNYKQAVEKGFTDYCILNVGNIREFAEGIRETSELEWNFKRFDLKEFLIRYSQMEYGCDLSEAYKTYYSGFCPIPDELSIRIIQELVYNLAPVSSLPDHEVLMDGVVRKYGLALIAILSAREAERDELKRQHEKVLLYCDKNFPQAMQKWRDVYVSLCETRKNVAPARREFYDDHILLQVEFMLSLHEWLNDLWNACKTGNEACIRAAACTLERYLVSRTRTEHDKWENWFRGDIEMNIPEVLRKTKLLLEPREGRPHIFNIGGFPLKA
jgi:hypothetical protein